MELIYRILQRRVQRVPETIRQSRTGMATSAWSRALPLASRPIALSAPPGRLHPDPQRPRLDLPSHYSEPRLHIPRRCCERIGTIFSQGAGQRKGEGTSKKGREGLGIAGGEGWGSWREAPSAILV